MREHQTVQVCGCKVVDQYTNRLDETEGAYIEVKTSSHYIPCYACALINAGIMLQEAGKRVKEGKFPQVMIHTNPPFPYQRPSGV